MNTRTKAGRSKQARARKIDESVCYRVWVVGMLWQGTKGATSYNFMSPSQEPTEQQVLERAGDFSDVLDYEIVKIRTITYTDGDRRIVKVVRPWNSVENGEFCCDVYGC